MQAQGVVARWQEGGILNLRLLGRIQLAQHAFIREMESKIDSFKEMLNCLSRPSQQHHDITIRKPCEMIVVGYVAVIEDLYG